MCIRDRYKDVRSQPAAEGAVVLYQEHRGLIFQDQLLHLDAGKQVDIVQRLVPHIEVGALAQAGGQQELLPVSYTHLWGAERSQSYP